jgi:hypothetical protein
MLLGCEAGFHIIFRDLEPEYNNRKRLYCSEFFKWMDLKPVTARQV